MVLGLTAAAVALGFCSESRLVVLVRRELASFFFTPVAYLVLIGFTMITWVGFLVWFLNFPGGKPHPEPIVSGVFLQWPGVFLMLFGIPALTMRLVSEEKRTGTLEGLMTTPTEETTLVLAKFIAVFILFMAMWLPFALFIVAFRIMAGADFDYLPLLSFTVSLAVTGAGFLAAGLFFSSLTENQMVGGILTFVFIMAMTFIFIVGLEIQGRGLPFLTWIKPEDIKKFFVHISYIDIWLSSLSGKLFLPPLLFFGSMAVWFLFLTAKVLEARKWM
jgi:ABC-2 type transport system permease protein